MKGMHSAVYPHGIRIQMDTMGFAGTFAYCMVHDTVATHIVSTIGNCFKVSELTDI
jgi:hypothetical protein